MGVYEVRNVPRQRRADGRCGQDVPELPDNLMTRRSMTCGCTLKLCLRTDSHRPLRLTGRFAIEARWVTDIAEADYGMQCDAAQITSLQSHAGRSRSETTI